MLEGLKGAHRSALELEHLLKIDPNMVTLNEAKKGKHHQVNLKNLWVSQHSRPDLQLTIRFYYAREKNRMTVSGQN